MTEETNVDAGTTEQTPSWYLDDNIPGQGARPDWLPAKYQKVSDLGKAYTEAEKRLGGFTGAPENYDFDGIGVDAQDPTIQALADVGKKHNMNQQVFSEMVGRLVSIQETTEQLNIDKEIEKLGPDGTRMLQEYKNWVNDYIPAPEQEVVTQWVKTADDLKAFNRIMAHTHMSQVPTHQSMHIANNFEGVKELKAELAKNLEKFKNDATYRKDYSARMHRALARNPNDR